VTNMAKVLCVSRTPIYRVAARYRRFGISGPEDWRRHNGAQKIDGVFLSLLVRVIATTPQDHAWRRPTWTREMSSRP